MDTFQKMAVNQATTAKMATGITLDLRMDLLRSNTEGPLELPRTSPAQFLSSYTVESSK
jgi:hypothetical protein